MLRFAQLRPDKLKYRPKDHGVDHVGAQPGPESARLRGDGHGGVQARQLVAQFGITPGGQPLGTIVAPNFRHAGHAAVANPTFQFLKGGRAVFDVVAIDDLILFLHGCEWVRVS